MNEDRSHGCHYYGAFVEKKRLFTMGNVVDAVQVALAVLIVHVLAFGCHDLDGIVAEENLARRPAK